MHLRADRMTRQRKSDIEERERLAFKYLAEGKNKGEIARLLQVHPDTVGHVFCRAANRLGAENTYHALALVLKAEIQPVKPPEGVD